MIDTKYMVFCTAFTLASVMITKESIHAQNQWPEPTGTNKPWIRWWWMGNAVDEQNLARELNEFSTVGFGGVEITPLYGAKGYESKYVQFLSSRWVSLLDYTVKTAKQNHLQVDINAGTGWPFGGPQITPEYAAGKLIVENFTVEPGKKSEHKIIASDSTQRALGASLRALLALGPKGEKVILTDKVSQEGTLGWTTPSGSSGVWKLYAAFGGKTGQLVKRAAPGGEGYTMDHLSKEAFLVYLKRFDDALGKNNNHGIRSFFNDSYEVYDADFTPDLFTEFRKRRGYDLSLYLPELIADKENDSIKRIRADYRQTMAELVYERFSTVWYDWVNNKKSLSRNQAHGFPGNIIDIYARVDIPEPEMFGIIPYPIKEINYYTTNFRHAPPDPVMMKLASSAAHLMGKPLVSCEIFTWLGEHFKIPLSHCKPEAQQAFLVGVNHTIYHGTTYSPEEAGWPGWLFYASTNFAPSNSWWPHVKGLNTYITRCQSILQKGKTENELLVYWPYHDAQYHAGKKLDFQVAINSVDDWLIPTPFYKLSRKMMNEGFGVDFVSDNILAETHSVNDLIKASENGSAYKTLIIPVTEFMPTATLKNIIRIAEEGGRVIFQSLPGHTPGLLGIATGEKALNEILSVLRFSDTREGLKIAATGKGTIILADDIAAAIGYLNIMPEAFGQDGIEHIRKNIDGDTYYYLVNHTANDIDKEITFNKAGTHAIIMDPETGETGLAESSVNNDKTRTRIQLKSGEALFVQLTDKNVTGITRWKYNTRSLPSITINAPWSLTFRNRDRSTLKQYQLKGLSSWTDLKDSIATKYSGIGVYETEFEFNPVTGANEYLLQLDDVRESAEVWLNENYLGILWNPPYETKIGQYLKKGKNKLRIEVANLMANGIADLDRKGIVWRNFHEINFVNVNYESFDASRWPLQPSGLLNEVKIKPVILQ